MTDKSGKGRFVMKRRLHLVGNSQRLRILKRDNYTCQYCFEAATEIDHIIPYSYIPDNADSNLVSSCGECNRLASNMVFLSFNEKYMYIKRRRAQRGKRHYGLVTNINIDKTLRPPKIKAVKSVKPKAVKPPKKKREDNYDPAKAFVIASAKIKKKLEGRAVISAETRALLDKIYESQTANLPPEIKAVFDYWRYRNRPE